MLTMVDIPEEQQASALRLVAELSARRTAALEEADAITAELREAAVSAARTGAQRGRIRELAKVSPNTLTNWLSSAGLEVRSKTTKEGNDS
jgi:O-methyltransferase involved in polyketide biosynthesis